MIIKSRVRVYTCDATNFTFAIDPVFYTSKLTTGSKLICSLPFFNKETEDKELINRTAAYDQYSNRPLYIPYIKNFTTYSTAKQAKVDLDVNHKYI